MNTKQFIEKKRNVFLINKLRTILLFEPDFNYLNKVAGGRMMANAEVNNLMAPEQYGSQKSHSPIHQCLNKGLTYDDIRQKKIPASMVSQDAEACYDRILHVPAGLSMIRAGLPPLTATVMLDTVQKLKHHLRTAYGK
jgi:hypothetical protein